MKSMRGSGASAAAFFHEEDEGDHAGRADGEDGDDVEVGELGALLDELLVEAALGKGTGLGLSLIHISEPTRP